MRNLNGHLIRIFSFFLLSTVFCILSSPASSQEATEPTGQVAYIGEDRNIYIYNFAEGEATVVTDDAEVTRRYQYPTWSTDGRLAYFCCEFSGGGSPVLEAYVLSPTADEPRLIYTAEGEAFTYANWSPANNCADVASCRQLGLLVSQASAGEFKVELIQDNADGAETSDHLNIGTGAPFYFSWSPDGSQMAWYRNNRFIDIYQVEKNSVVDSLELESVSFAAPMWSPVGDRVLFADRGEQSGLNLTTIEAMTPNIIAESSGGFVAFNWSPDGQYIAYRSVLDNGYGNVEVVDATTGDSLISAADNAIAFFWSPDSRKIAYVSLIEVSRSQSVAYQPLQQDLQQQDSDFALGWAVLSLDDGSTAYFDTFIPTPETVYTLTYFDQFAQSHRFWSPDSRYLVYGEFIEDGKPQVTILDTEDESALPFAIAEGTLGIWSY